MDPDQVLAQMDHGVHQFQDALVWDLLCLIKIRLGTVNLKFHLIQSFFEIFARFLSFHA